MVAAWKVMGEEKTGRVVELGDIKAAEKNMIESQSHQSKLRAGKHVCTFIFCIMSGTKVEYL